eukprot:NODE_1604_length_1358_cov_10.437739_g1329_i0.p1 GENE.NODE_1604_length_1358_cov_10.437739_g1329_i0~~NODE_1604_length_1358_cov_10.437739_g1329_i0.p1  ORF type:complete len:386 (-),score=22.71 NODE_1604_length_1358_cov_10.437739_g1329_i0:33-1190(-)
MTQGALGLLCILALSILAPHPTGARRKRSSDPPSVELCFENGPAGAVCNDNDCVKVNCDETCQAFAAGATFGNQAFAVTCSKDSLADDMKLDWGSSCETPFTETRSMTCEDCVTQWLDVVVKSKPGVATSCKDLETNAQETPLTCDGTCQFLRSTIHAESGSITGPYICKVADSGGILLTTYASSDTKCAQPAAASILDWACGSCTSKTQADCVARNFHAKCKKSAMLQIGIVIAAVGGCCLLCLCAGGAALYWTKCKKKTGSSSGTHSAAAEDQGGTTELLTKPSSDPYGDYTQLDSGSRGHSSSPSPSNAYNPNLAASFQGSGGNYTSNNYSSANNYSMGAYPTPQGGYGGPPQGAGYPPPGAADAFSPSGPNAFQYNPQSGF